MGRKRCVCETKEGRVELASVLGACAFVGLLRVCAVTELQLHSSGIGTFVGCFVCPKTFVGRVVCPKTFVGCFVYPKTYYY